MLLRLKKPFTKRLPLEYALQFSVLTPHMKNIVSTPELTIGTLLQQAVHVVNTTRLLLQVVCEMGALMLFVLGIPICIYGNERELSEFEDFLPKITY